MTQKGGKKKELTKAEIEHYTEELEGEYTIGEQLGRSGAMTSAYLLTDKNGGHFVLKIPNRMDELEKWINTQKLARDRRNSYVGDYQGRINVPSTIKIGKDFVIEELVEGKEFFASVYEELPPIQKKKVAQDLAEFMNYTHQRTATGKNVKTHPNQQKRLSWKETYEYFAPVLTEDEKKELQREIQIHEQQEAAPEVLAFRDYRYANMLWDDRKKRLSIIDFDFTRQASVYEEFTPPSAAGARISYQFLRDVVNAYNHAPKKRQIFIDLETVRHNCFLGLYHEYARHNIGQNPPEHDLEALRADLRELNKWIPPTSTPRKTLEKGNITPKVRKGEPR